jgi:amino acid transporter
LASQNKFGFFGGVFTPSILTILGVIMYMRLGWVVGHAGLTGSIVIILIAHIISIATGLSISSIATNKKVGAGGVYYVVSRSLGLPMGGAIGYTLFIATSFSIALYLIGFAENFNPVLGMGSTINDFRVSGTLALLLLTILVYISTSVAIKSQYLILGAIVLSLVSIFFGDIDGGDLISNVVSPEKEVSFALLFGIFFPAVTGFTAGIAMSGDLENPKKDIPIGTMLAIGVGLVIYIVLAIFLSVRVDDSLLQSNYNILMDIALFAPLVIAGIWGATLSSALGGLLGGPRIFQAMSVDNITPYSKTFANGSGKSNEPRNALILTILIAEVGVLIGELDAIARLVSMFYLMAYNFINLSFFLESWANSDFLPKFKVSKWVGAIGFLATFTVMFQIDPFAMVLAYMVLFGTYFFLKRKEMSLNSGDIWGSVWSSVVKAGLKRMDGFEENQNYWRPNVLLFSGGTEKRPYLIEISKDLGGRSGMISNFDLIESPEAKVLFPKKDKGIKTTDIREDGIFTRRQEVKDIYTGIETIASVYGFSGIEPNTVLMGWARNTKFPSQFANLTQALIDLDYNVLYLDYDEKRGFGQYESIDLWWRGISNNVILTIRLVKFILSSQRWANASVRVILVNDDKTERRQIQERITSILTEFRLQAEIKIINNSVEKLSIFELMKHYSQYADLVFLGVPDRIDDVETYVSKTNNLLDNIGTTLMVRASSQFSEISLGFKPTVQEKVNEVKLLKLKKMSLPFDDKLNRQIQSLEEHLFKSNQMFTQGAVSVIISAYVQIFEEYQSIFTAFFEHIESKKSTSVFKEQFLILHRETMLTLDQFLSGQTQHLTALLDDEIEKWTQKRNAIFARNPEVTQRILSLDDIEKNKSDNSETKWIKFEKRFIHKLFGKSSIEVDWKDMLEYYESTINLTDIKKMLHDLGMIEALNIKALRERTMIVLEELLDGIILEPEKRTVLVNEAKKQVESGLSEQIDLIKQKPEQLLSTANYRDREMVLKIVELTKRLDVNSIIEDLEDGLKKGEVRKIRNQISEYSSFWSRNQKLFGNLFQTWVVTTRLHVELVFLKEKVARDARIEVFGMFRRVSKHLDQLFLSSDNSDKENTRITSFDESELLSHNPSEFLSRVQEEMRDSIANLPESIDLINEDSVLNFEDFQEEDVEQVTIDLQKIADYYLELDFIEPLNRRITHTYNIVATKFEEMGNRISYINQLGENQTSESKNQVDQLKQKLIIDIEELNQLIENTEIEFVSMLEKQFSELSSKLSVSELLTTSNSLSRFVHIKHGYLGFFKRIEKIKTYTFNLLSNSIFEIKRKQHQLRLAEFNERNKTLVNKRKMFRNFVELNGINEDVNSSLPTYYRHLFSGKQVFNKQTAIDRGFEIDQAVAALNKGETGGVLVISEPLAGKSHFVESMLHQINPSRIVRILPPSQGLNENSSLLSAFQKSTGLEGNFFNIMSSLPEGTVFTFNKLELWWLRKNNGGKLIDQLVWLIERYGERHRFVLTMNIYAYDLVRQITNIDSVLAATIILPPANGRELAELMLNRHQLAGVNIVFENKPDKHPTKRDLIKHFEKYVNGANGNIGVAMLRWLSSIQKYKDDMVYVKEYKEQKLPSMFPITWGVLLTHIVLHEKLHLNNIIEIFELQDKSTVHRVVKELIYTKLIKEVSKNTYVIEPLILKWVIEQLKTQNYLNKYE